MEPHPQMVRVRLDWRGLVRLFELPGPDVVLGRDTDADVCIDHPSVAQRHAKILIRRGRLIALELGGVVGLGERRLLAPATLGPNQEISLGDVTMTASLAPRSAVGLVCAGVHITREIDAIDPETRRYEGERDGRFEITVLDSDVDAPGFEERVNGRPAMVERIPPGVSLTRLLSGIRAGRVQPGPEIAIVIVRRVAEQLVERHEIGPHAAVRSDVVFLTERGDVKLLSPGPGPMFPTHAARYCSPGRRMNLPPAISDDAFALRVIAAELAGDLLSQVVAPLAGAKTRGAFKEAVHELVRRSLELPLDPAERHVARIAQLLAPPTLRMKSRIEPSKFDG